MVKTLSKKLVNDTHDLIFRMVHNRYLIYNVCWEDPRIDRQVLNLDRDSKVVVLTSAGCNTLDYLLDGPAEIHAVDVNPRQNALLHLKLALIERGNFDDLFTMFGNGSHDRFRTIYDSLRQRLPEYAREFWDGKIQYFDSASKRRSFYYYGTSGIIAWILKRYLMRSEQKSYLFDLLDAQSLDEQKEIYQKVEPILWNRLSSWLVKQPMTMTMIGVPRPQIRLIKDQYDDGLLGYVSSRLRHVLTEVLIRDNYFWRVYLTGSYTADCCPNYLKAENFELLRAQSGNVRTHNSTVTDFLKQHPGSYSHFILLDHQDWLAWHNPDALREEWDLILQNSRPGAKVLMRSAAIDVSFIPEAIRSCLQFFPELTERLHRQDRVGTYASMHFAEVL